MVYSIKFALAWCNKCKQAIQCQYTTRKPVGIECPDCEQPSYVMGVSINQLRGMRLGDGLYLDWEVTK